MSDKELLEFAAKAAGVEGVYRINGYRGICGISTSMDAQLWNPLTDDGDAIRLAVKLHLDINVYRNSNEVAAVQHRQNEKYSRHFVQVKDGDWLSATRRAIVLAAAEIGKENEDEHNIR